MAGTAECLRQWYEQVRSYLAIDFSGRFGFPVESVL